MRSSSFDFGRCWGAAGVQGFFGNGYWFHKIPFRKPDFSGMTFVSKTATLHPRQGNLKKGWKELLLPSWARIKPFSGHTLNAMGLPNSGIKALLETGKWQQREKPFFISIMAVEDTLEKRMEELRRIVGIIGESMAKCGFKTWVGLQVNRSCPNTGHDINVGEIVRESELGLSIIYTGLGWPVVEKFAIDTAPLKAIMELDHNPWSSGICVSNTVKFDYLGLGRKIFHTDVSPLKHLGGGGISGPELLPLVCDYIKVLRDRGFKKPINGGGGIFHQEDVDEYHRAGADSIFVGTVATHHPRRVAQIIRHANGLHWQ